MSETNVPQEKRSPPVPNEVRPFSTECPECHAITAGEAPVHLLDCPQRVKPFSEEEIAGREVLLRHDCERLHIGAQHAIHQHNSERRYIATIRERDKRIAECFTALQQIADKYDEYTAQPYAIGGDYTRECSKIAQAALEGFES